MNKNCFNLDFIIRTFISLLKTFIMIMDSLGKPQKESII